MACVQENAQVKNVARRLILGFAIACFEVTIFGGVRPLLLLFWRAAAKRPSSTFSSRHLDSVRGLWSSATDLLKKPRVRVGQFDFLRRHAHVAVSSDLKLHLRPSPRSLHVASHLLRPPKGTTTASRSTTIHRHCCRQLTPHNRTPAGAASLPRWRPFSRMRTAWYGGTFWQHSGRAPQS